MNRKRLILAVLVGLLILSLAYAFWATPRQEQAAPRTEGARAAAKKAAPGKTAPPPGDRLHLGLLSQQPQPFAGASRDIFRFRGGGSSAAGTPEAAAPPAVEETAPPPPPPPPPTPEEILRDKVSGVTVLGSLDKGGVKTVFLSYGGAVAVVKAGESFGKTRDLVAQEITDKELVIGSAEGPETVRIKLIESEAPSLTTISSGEETPGAARGGAVRPGGMVIPPRRGILQPRMITPPPEEEGLPQEEPPPNEDVTQEEILNEEPPSGEGNGNN